MRRRPLLILVAVATAPLAVSVLVSLVQWNGPLYPLADHAGLEIQTISAEHGDKFTGTHSRFGWYHPAPSYFYLLAPLYQLLGKSPAGLNATVTLLNLLAVAAIVGITWRQAGRTPALLAGAAVAVLIARLGPQFLRDYWVPFSVMLPFGAHAFACAAVACGRLAYLPLMAGIGSFVAGNNLSSAPATLALAVTAVVLCVIARLLHLPPGAANTWKRAALAIGATLLVIAAMWALPVYDELEHKPGNFSAMREWFDSHPGEHTASEGMGALAYGLTRYFWLPGGGHVEPADSTAVEMVFLMLVITALGLGTVVGIARKRWFGVTLCAICFAGMAAEMIAIPNVRGPLYGWIVTWFGAICPAIIVGVGLTLGPELRGLRGRLPTLPGLTLERGLAVILAGVTAFSLVQLARKAPLTKNNEYAHAYVGPIYKKLDAWFKDNRVRRPYFNVTAGGIEWFDGAALAARRARTGAQLAIGGPPQGAFGKPHLPNDQEDADVWILGYDVKAPRPLRLLARAGVLSVWVHKRPV